MVVDTVDRHVNHPAIAGIWDLQDIISSAKEVAPRADATGVERQRHHISLDEM
jgi:hypothetical protein